MFGHVLVKPFDSRLSNLDNLSYNQEIIFSTEHVIKLEITAVSH